MLVRLPNAHLHPLIYFIADKPAKGNLSPTVPLVGTQSYKTLLNWIGECDFDISRVRLYNQCDGPFDTFMSKVTLNQAVGLGQIKVIALGKKAQDYLLRANIDEFFSLPHPSPANKASHKNMKEKLGAVRSYVYQGMVNEESSSCVTRCP